MVLIEGNFFIIPIIHHILVIIYLKVYILVRIIIINCNACIIFNILLNDLY